MSGYPDEFNRNLCKSWIKVKVVKWCRKKVHKICECTCNGFEFHVSITIVAHAMYYFLSFAIKQGGNGENKTLPSSIIIRSIHRIICNVLLDNQDRTRLQRHWWWKENSTRWEAVGNTGPSVGVLKGGYRNLTGRSVFLGVPRCSKMFPDVPRCSQLILDVPRCS